MKIHAAILLLVLFPGAMFPNLFAGGARAPAEADVRSAGISGLLNRTWPEIEAQAKQEKEVVVVCWADEAAWNQIGRIFSEKYKIKFTLIIGEKIAVMNKALAEKDGKGTMDVIGITGETQVGLVNGGVLAPGILPKLQE
jgi:putative spermidine/putrescine transport system substrate-binding protein